MRLSEGAVDQGDSSVSLLELPLGAAVPGHSLFRAALRLGLSLETAGPTARTRPSSNAYDMQPAEFGQLLNHRIIKIQISNHVG